MLLECNHFLPSNDLKKVSRRKAADFVAKDSQ